MDDDSGDPFGLPFGPMAADVPFRVDLPLDPATMDVVCRRGETPGVRHFNVPQRHVHHAPTGFKWGYAGRGPADFALNVLALFVPCAQDRIGPPAADAPAAEWEAYAVAAAADERVELRDGSIVAAAVWEHYVAFEEEVIAALPFAGGTIEGDAIRAWLRARGVEPAA